MAIYADARTARDVALDPRWFEGLPDVVRAQADTTRAATDAFLDLFRAHMSRGDAIRARAQLLAPVTDASAKLAALEATLLPLLDHRLADAEEREWPIQLQRLRFTVNVVQRIRNSNRPSLHRQHFDVWPLFAKA